jgi:hypothetical protein
MAQDGSRVRREKRGPVVVVTGASAGVGRATVRAFARRGAAIGLLARGRDGLEAARREMEDKKARDDSKPSSRVAAPSRVNIACGAGDGSGASLPPARGPQGAGWSPIQDQHQRASSNFHSSAAPRLRRGPGRPAPAAPAAAGPQARNRCIAPAGEMRIMTRSKGSFRIGTSGYQYDHWRGLF